MSRHVASARSAIAVGLLAALFGCRGESLYHRKDGVWYWKNDKIDVPAGAMFTPLNGAFAVAGGRGYFRGDRIADSDGATFQALDEAHAKDARQVWYSDTFRNSQEYFLVKRRRATAIAGADAGTYQRAAVVRDANPHAFTVPR